MVSKISDQLLVPILTVLLREWQALLAMSGQCVLLVELDSQGGCAVSLGIATDSHNCIANNVL